MIIIKELDGMVCDTVDDEYITEKSRANADNKDE